VVDSLQRSIENADTPRCPGKSQNTLPATLAWNQRYTRLHIGTRLVLLVLALAVPLLGFSIASSVRETRIETDQAAAQMPEDITGCHVVRRPSVVYGPSSG